MATSKSGPGPLAEAVRARRLELGLRQGDLAPRGGPSLATMGQIESGKMRTPRPLTLGGLDRALGWVSGSAAGILKGRPPVIPMGVSETVYEDGSTDTVRSYLVRPVGLGLDDAADGLTPEQIESVRAVIRAMKPTQERP